MKFRNIQQKRHPTSNVVKLREKWKEVVPRALGRGFVDPKHKTTHKQKL